MRQLLPILIGLPIGWILMMSAGPITAVVTVLWMLLNPEKSQELLQNLSGGFMDSIQNVRNVTTQHTSTDSVGDSPKTTGGVSRGTE